MKSRATATTAIVLSLWALGMVAALAYDILGRPDRAAPCRVRGFSSEEEYIRAAVATADRAKGDKIAALIKALGIE